MLSEGRGKHLRAGSLVTIATLLLGPDEGQDLVEYTLLVFLIAIAVVALVSGIGETITARYLGGLIPLFE